MAAKGAFTRTRTGFTLRIPGEERALVARLLDELSELLTSPQPPPATARLFPVVHPDNPEREAEYQRLMRDELVASRLAAIEAVRSAFEATAPRSRGKGTVNLTDEQFGAFIQSVNGVRLVLGTILDIDEDDELPDGFEEHVPVYQLYAYLSWLLDSAVRAASPTT